MIKHLCFPCYWRLSGILIPFKEYKAQKETVKSRYIIINVKTYIKMNIRITKSLTASDFDISGQDRKFCCSNPPYVFCIH